MAHFFPEASRTFSEYLLLPNLTTKGCIPENVILRTPLVKFKVGQQASLEVNIPFASAIMQAVSDHNWQLPWRDRAGSPLFMGPKVLKNRQRWSKQLKATKRVSSSATQI